MNKINKKLLVENLRELADRSLQERLWIHGDAQMMSSFTEAICGAFDDAGLSRALDSGEAAGELSSAAWRIARALDSAVEAIPEDESPETIVAHPKMDLVRKLSADLLAHLDDG